MSYNITFTTSASFKFVEKWLNLSLVSWLLVISFGNDSSLLAIILYKFSGKNFDTLPTIGYLFINILKLK